MNQKLEQIIVTEILKISGRNPRTWFYLNTNIDTRVEINYGHVLSNGEHERAIGTVIFEMNGNGAVDVTFFAHT